VRLTRQRLPASATARLLRGDATRLPFRDESFDRAVSTYLLDLLEEDAVLDALSELRRVLKPGGVVVCAGLTSRGASPSARIVASGYALARKVRPLWVG